VTLSGSVPEEPTSATRAFDDDHAPLYTVGQVADMLGVQPAFLRRLDAEAVVQPARSDGGQRRYTRLDIYLVERVVGLAEEGLTLAGIRRLLVLEDRVRDLQCQLDDKQADQPGGPAAENN
jgi:DNA-binding transcriptional MerR regulator